MAVTLTRGNLALALGIVTDPSDTIDAGQQAVLDRLLGTCTATVEAIAPNAPAAIQNEAVIRCAGFLFDLAPEDTRAQNPLRASGALALLSQWIDVRLVGAGESTVAPSAAGGVDTAAVNALITAALAGYVPVDQTARSAAAAADAKAVAAQNTADGKADSPITDGDIPASIARDAEVTAALDARVSAAAAGRIPSAALPAPSSQNNGKVIGITGTAYEAVDKAAATGNDATARSAAAAADAKAVAAQAEADENEQAIAGLQAVTRDLHRGAETTALAENTDTALGSLHVDTGGSLDASAATFAAEVDRPGGGWHSASRIVVKLANTESRSKWRARLVGDGGQAFDIAGGQWSPLTVTNPAAGFTYYQAESGEVLGEAVARVELWTSSHPTTFSGLLAAGIVKLASLAADLAARLLPASGGGVGKFLGWSGSAPAWVDAPSGGGLTITDVASVTPAWNSLGTLIAQNGSWPDKPWRVVLEAPNATAGMYAASTPIFKPGALGPSSGVAELYYPMSRESGDPGYPGYLYIQRRNDVHGLLRAGTQQQDADNNPTGNWTARLQTLG